jgi:hypothetical protein
VPKFVVDPLQTSLPATAPPHHHITITGVQEVGTSIAPVLEWCIRTSDFVLPAFWRKEGHPREAASQVRIKIDRACERSLLGYKLVF